MSRPSFNLENLIVRAGAGAGKTTELTERVLGIAESFYSSHQRYPRLVVTTFTRKATQELRERLLKKALESVSDKILDFVKRPHLLHISTIHGVLSLFLQQFGSRIQLSPEIRFISPKENFRQLKRITRKLAEQDESFAQALENCLETLSLADFLREVENYGEDSVTKNVRGPFTEAEMEAAIHREKQALVKIAQDLSRQISDEAVSGSWKELGALLEGVGPATDWRAVYQACPTVRKSKTTSEKLIEIKDDFFDLIEKVIAFNRSSEFVSVHEALSLDFQKCAEQIFNMALAHKIKSGEITMSDLEILAAKILSETESSGEESPALIFSEKWDYWLVDEYQDTSPLQVYLIEKLKGRRNEFVVGDPQQSIYLFRGARSEVFAAKELAFQSGAGRVASKLKNYRSDPELLVFFNEVFSQMAAKGSHQFGKMEPKSDQFNPEKIVATLYYFSPDKSEGKEKDSSTSRDEGLKGEIEIEFQAAVDRCYELAESGISLEKICILFRSNRGIEDFVAYANQLQLPVQVHSSGQFGQRPEIVEINCILQFLLNPFHNTNLIQLLRMPGFCISDSELVQTLQKSKSSFFWNQIKSLGHPTVQKLQEILQARDSFGLGPSLLKVIEGFQFFEQCHRVDPSGFREANIWKYLQMLQESEKLPGFSYQNFLENLSSLASSTEDSSEQVAVPVVAPAKVNLMTIHASKGLQFQHVIVPKIAKSSRGDTGSHWMREEPLDITTEIRWTMSLPDPETGVAKKSIFGEQILRDKNHRSRLEEERVFYVALTRAIETVTLIGSGKIEKESWLGLLNLPTAEGTYPEARYSIRVKNEISHKIQKGMFGEELSLHQPKSALELSKIFAEKATVTALLESSQKSSPEIQKTKMADVSKAVLGTRVHRALENIKYFLMKNEISEMNEWLFEAPEDLRLPIQFLRDNQEGPWIEIIQNGEVEFGFAAKVGSQFIQGQIDLWGRDHQGQLWIVDYKTGSPAHVENAFAQLAIYLECLRAMRKFSPIEEVKLAVIYPFEKKVFVR